MNCDELLPRVPLEGQKRHDPDPGGWIVRQGGHGRRDFPVMLSCYMFGSITSQGFVGSREALWRNSLPYASQASGKYLEFTDSMVDWYAINSGNRAGVWDTTTYIYLDQASSQVTKSLMRLLGEGPPTSGSTSSTVRELFNCNDSRLGAPRTLGRRQENSMNSPRTIRSWRAAGDT